MPEQALYLKWRPTIFEDVVGQDHITKTLRSALKTGRVRHAYLFSGPRGTGKTTSARLLAKALNCTHDDIDRRPCNECPHCIAVNEGRFLDLIEIDAATHTGVDDVRDLREKIAFTPGEGKFKVYIIDEVHRFSGSAFDALLKTLEEPPDHAIFVLATTEIDKVPQTIKSRCLQFEFRRLTVREVADRLGKICDAEGLTYDRPALELIARYGTGSVRDSISLLDQIVTDPDEKISLGLVERVLGTASSAAVRELVAALIDGDPAEGLRVIAHAVDNGADPRQFGTQIIEHLRAVMIAQTAGVEMLEVSPEERALYGTQAEQIERGVLLRAIRAFNEALTARAGWQPQLGLELALIEALREPEVTYTEAPAPRAERAPASSASAKPVAPPALAANENPLQIGDLTLTAAEINKRWEKILSRIRRYSRTAPEVMKYFRAHRVDGAVIFLATDNEMYFRRIEPFPEKRMVIEKALSEEFGAELKIRIVMAGGDSGSAADLTDDESHDSLIATGIELGAQVKRVEKKE